MAAISPSDRIVVGVDFGTTFSGKSWGVAFTYSANPEAPDEIAVIKNWPGGNRLTSDKVPTEITYNGNSLAAPRWGYEIKPEEPRIRYMKLLLDERQELPKYVSRVDLLQQLDRDSKTPQGVVAEYLTNLHEHMKKELAKRFGDEMLSTTELQFILTVPAVWSDRAKHATLQAAELAGFGKSLRLISEPEAAAVYALKSLQHNDLKVGDNFIVCDAGGGTVDLISYEIEQLCPLRLRESVPGTGALCGSAFLNLRFEELVKSRLGGETVHLIRTQQPKSWAVAQKYFEEYVKRNFDPSDSRDQWDDTMFNVPFPGVTDNIEAGVDGGFLVLSTAEVAEIFRPIISHVCGLVERQRAILAAYGKSAKGVVLVGGFGQSNHLYTYLKNHFADDDPPPPYEESRAAEVMSARFMILQPVNAWTAVVRGAVLRGLEGAELVSSRKARRHYGVKVNVAFDAKVHSIANRFWDDFTGTWRASNQITWFVKRGQTVSSEDCILYDFYNNCNTKEQTGEAVLIYCDEERAPVEFRSGPAATTKVLCVLSTNLGDIPDQYWSTCHSFTGQQYFKVTFKLGMQIESGRLCFDRRVGGVVYGSITADFA